jgi:hypothetical protein
LYQDDYQTLRRVAADVFGAHEQFFLFNDFIKQRKSVYQCVVALGKGSGREVKLGQQLSMDWVLALVTGSTLRQYVGLEVQSIDITGNYRDAWHAYKHLKPKSSTTIPASEHGLNWANVHKRLIPQIIRKGLIYSRSKYVKQGLHFIVPEIVYRKFELILGADMKTDAKPGPNTLTVHTYGLSNDRGHGQQRVLIPARSLRIGLDDFASRFVTGPTLPAPEVLDSAVMSVLGCK